MIRPLEREAERNVEVMWLTVKETTSRGFMLGFIYNGVGALIYSSSRLTETST